MFPHIKLKKKKSYSIFWSSQFLQPIQRQQVCWILVNKLNCLFHSPLLSERCSFPHFHLLPTRLSEDTRIKHLLVCARLTLTKEMLHSLTEMSNKMIYCLHLIREASWRFKVSRYSSQCSMVKEGLGTLQRAANNPREFRLSLEE